MTISTYTDFWPFYLSQHRYPSTRAIHFAGAAGFMVLTVVSLATLNGWYVAAAFALFYLPAWVAHFFIEGNRPATWRYPLWSFVSDIRMFLFWLAGGLDREIERTLQLLPAAR